MDIDGCIGRRKLSRNLRHSRAWLHRTPLADLLVFIVKTDDMEHALCQVQLNRCNLHFGLLFFRFDGLLQLHRGAFDADLEGGGDHHIRLLACVNVSVERALEVAMEIKVKIRAGERQ
ncbi:MAG: hypothetical protein ACOY4D_06325 [Pseudomonadota bacterium]